MGQAKRSARSSPGKAAKTGKAFKDAALMLPPEHLQEALDALQQFAGPSGSALYASPNELPTSVRLCLATISSREILPKRLAMLKVDEPNSIVEVHAKAMSGKCSKCAELLRSKYTQLVDGKLGFKLASELPADAQAAFSLISCARKSPRFLWLQPPHTTLDEPFSLASLFEGALSTQKAWPAPLELDLAHATYSRELQLPYKDDRERDNIMSLHVKAQEVINQINDYSMELLRTHFETSVGKAKTLAELSRMHAGGEPEDERVRTLVNMHAALTSSTEPDGAVQTFYPLTEDEQEQLASAVRYVQHATDFSTAQSGLFMWMHSMSIFAHSVSHRWERNRLRVASDEEAVRAIRVRIPAGGQRNNSGGSNDSSSSMLLPGPCPHSHRWRAPCTDFPRALCLRPAPPLSRPPPFPP